MHTSINLPLGDDTFKFKLGLTEFAALESGGPHPDGNAWDRNRRPILIGEAYARILQGRAIIEGKDEGLPGHAAFSATELDAIIVMGLLGGGGSTDGRITWKEYDVYAWMKRDVYPLPLVDRWRMAFLILSACVEGIPDDVYQRTAA